MSCLRAIGIDPRKTHSCTHIYAEFMISRFYVLVSRLCFARINLILVFCVNIEF